MTREQLAYLSEITEILRYRSNCPNLDNLGWVENEDSGEFLSFKDYFNSETPSLS
jgi:hypothetical protein